MMVNLFHFKILARGGMVDIIVCRPKEMKRESLVEEDRSSIRKENNQNRDQEIIEDRPITKCSQRGKMQVEINNLKTQNTKSKFLNAAKRSNAVKRLHRSKRSNSWQTLANSGVDVQAWNMNCGFARMNYLEFDVNGNLFRIPANCTVVSD